jgi:hypothetical protein
MAQSINLVPNEEIKSQRKGKIVKLSSLISIVLLLAAAGVAGYFWYQLDSLNKELTVSKDKVSAHRRDIENLSSIEQTARELDVKYTAVNDFLSGNVAYSIILTEFDKRKLDDITIESFSFSDNSSGTSINISGSGSNYLSIAKFIEIMSDEDYALADSRYKDLFTSVTLNSVSRDAQSAEVSFFMVISYDTSLLEL